MKLHTGSFALLLYILVWPLQERQKILERFQLQPRAMAFQQCLGSMFVSEIHMHMAIQNFFIYFK